MSTLVLLAAGMGSRYGGLKQLDAFGPAGEALMDYSVFDAIRGGFERVVFVIRRDFEAQFREQVLARYQRKVACELAFQSPDDLPAPYRLPEGRVKPWGTGHAVLAARDLLKTPFAVCNADDFYGPEAYATMAAWLKASPAAQDWSMVGYRLKDTLSLHGTVSRGVCEVTEGYLSKVVERLAIAREGTQVVARGESPLVLDENGPVSMNFWGFTPGFVTLLEEEFARFLGAMKDPLKSEFLLPEVVGVALAKKAARVKVLTGGSHWFGVTYPDDKEAVRASLLALSQGGGYPSPLF